MARLGDVATYVNGYAFKPSDWTDKGLPIIRIQDLTGNSYQANRYDGEYLPKYEIVKGDVLISWSASLGVYVWDGEKALLNQHIFKVVFDKVEVSKSFFVHQVKHILENAGSKAHGATMKHLTKPVFDAFPFYLPPLDEQRRIAVVLDKVSDLIAKRRQQLEKLDELVKARFVEMFGDPLGKSKYARERIAQLGGVGTGNTPSMRVAKYYASDDIPFVKPSDMLENGVAIIADGTAFIAEAARTVARIVPAASVLVTCIGTIGKVGITSCECACNQQINYVTPRDDINVIYLAHCLSHCKQLLVEMSNAPVVPIINKSQFSAIEIPVPPLEQQKQFGSFFEQTGKVKSIISRDLEKLEMLKKSLMQKYFE